MTTQIAFLGVGAMGSRMAANLVQAGFDVKGFSPSDATRAAAAERGVTVVDSCAAAAQDADLICSCVPADEHLRAAYLGEAGALETAKPGAVCFDFSTVSQAASLEVAQEATARGLTFCDTPVAGSTAAAQGARVAVMVCGDIAAMEAHRDVLDAVGASVTHFGPNGYGLRMKYVTNLVLGIHVTAIAEGVNLGRRLDLPAGAMIDFLKGTSIPKLLDLRGKALVDRAYAPGFPVELLLKDLTLIGDEAAGADVPLPLGAAARQILTTAGALGHARSDMTAVAEAYAQLAGLDAQRGPTAN